MLITPKFDYVEGSFNTDSCSLTCVGKRNYAAVHLCVPADGSSWLIPVADIKLYDGDLLRDAEAVYEDAMAFGKEIADRWNAASCRPSKEDIVDRASRWFTDNEQVDGFGTVVKINRSELLSLVGRLYDDITKKEK